MSTVQITKESHENPTKFRCRYEDADQILGPNSWVPEDDSLPVIKSESKIAIIGGGFGGLSAALTCIKEIKEEDYVIFEKHADFGGTWYANTYPGCASDIPAVWYSFYSELNSNWSALRPPQYEMQEYIKHVVDKHKISDHGRFRTIITEARYRPKTADWILTARNLDNGQKLEHVSKIVLACQGGLVYPSQLKANGLENFKGEYMHSALWRHDVDFKGKNVVVVGNGCSAAQVIPALLDNYDPKLIKQVVRSKHWIMPPLPKIAYSLYRLLSFHRWGILFVRWVIATAAESKYPLYDGTGFWARIIRWYNTRTSLSYIKSTAPKKYHDLLIPDYKIGCKRMIYDYVYLPSLNDPRVDLTDDVIDHIEEKHVVLKSGTRVPADIIVACTGYDLRKAFSSFNYYGDDGVSLKDVWAKEGTSAYETLLVKNCPNLFVLGGPNSATGHSSVVLALENGANYFSKIAPKILDGTYKSIKVKSSVYDTWNTTVQEILKKKVFGTKIGGCVSWYTEGGRNETAYPFSQISAAFRMDSPKWEDLELEKGNSKKHV